MAEIEPISVGLPPGGLEYWLPERNELDNQIVDRIDKLATLVSSGRLSVDGLRQTLNEIALELSPEALTDGFIAGEVESSESLTRAAMVRNFVSLLGASEMVLDALSASEGSNGALPSKPEAVNNAAIQAKVAAAGIRPVLLQEGRYDASLTFTDQSVNLQTPNSVIVQQLGKSAIVCDMPLGPALDFTHGPIQFGPSLPTSNQVNTQLMTKVTVPSGDYSPFRANEIYHFSSNDTLAYSQQAYSTPGDRVLPAEYATLMGIGVDVTDTANGGPREGTIMTGASSGNVSVIQSVIPMDDTTAKLTVSALTANLTIGENLTIGGEVVGKVAATYLLFGKVFENSYVTQQKMRKLDTTKRITLDIMLDASSDGDAVIGSAQRKPAIQIIGGYRPHVRLRGKGAYTRAVQFVGSYMPTFDVEIDCLPNHAITSESAFGYGVEIRGATTGLSGRVIARRVRHAVTTNPSSIKPAGAQSYEQINPLWLGAGEGGLIHDSVGIDCYGAAFDSHEGFRGLVYDNCLGMVSASANRYNSSGGVFNNRAFGTITRNCMSIGGVDGFVDGSQGIDSGSRVYRSVILNCHAIDFQRDGFREGIPTNPVIKGGWDIIGAYGRGDGSPQNAPYFQSVFNIGRSGASRTRIIGGTAERFNGTPLSISNSFTELDIMGLFADYGECDANAVGATSSNSPNINVYGYSMKSPTANRPPSMFESMTGNAIWNIDPSCLSSPIRVTAPLYRVGTGAPVFNVRRYLETRSVSLVTADANLTLVRGSSTVQILDATLTANRTVTLPSTAGSAVRGQEHRFVHAGSASYTWSIPAVGRTLQPGQWVDVVCVGTTWRATAWG